MIRQITFWLLLGFIISLSIQAQVPRYYDNNPAFDLTYQGKELLPEEVHDLYINSKKKFDLSMLNPVETTDLWKNQPAKPLSSHNNNLGLEYMEELSFDSFVPSRTGNFRFNVTKNVGDNNLIYTLFLSKNVHNILLAQGLLRKLGYEVPAIQYLPRIQIQFKTVEEKKGFIGYLEQEAMAGDAENWLIEEPTDTKIILQDIVALDAQNIIYNLAVGKPPEGLIEGRRLLSALSLPYSIVNVPESVNLMKWQASRVASNSVILDLDNANEFETNYEDARWIARRIEKLTRVDWEEIVDNAQLPKPVGLLLVEKLIARRNSVLRSFKIDSADIKVNDQVNSGVELVDGKLTKEYWDGYASRFAFGDPDSPLSASEMGSWAKSKAISYAIDAAVAGINSIPYLSTDIAKLMEKSDDELKQIFTDNFAKIKPNKLQVLPLDTWIFPTYKAQIGFSRSIVAGSYLGTDNLVQLADSISVTLGGGITGAYGGWISGKITQEMMDKLGQNAMDLTPVSASASFDVSYSRSFTHLRPVTSVKKALKYPFKNVFIPILKLEFGKQLAKAMSLNLSELKPEERAAKISEVLKPFKEKMDIGESLLVTDSLNFGVSAKASVNYAQNMIKAQLGVGANQIVTMRLHIFRKSENIIQIYQDFGEMTGLQAFFAFDSYIPILKIKAGLNRGTAKIKFYQLNLNPNNENVLEHIAALRNALVLHSMKKAKKLFPPYIVKHDFKERTANIGLFSLRLNKVNSATRMSVEIPGNEKREFFRRYWGRTLGNDYQDYLNDLIGNTVSLLLKTNFNASSSSSNPGYSLYGKAINKLISYEAELNPNGTVKEPFIKFNRIWNGWSVKRKNAQKILNKLKTQYRFDFYEPTVLSSTNKIYLYNISLNIYVYKKGIEHMMNLSDAEIERIFKNFQRVNDLTINKKEEIVNTGFKRYQRMVKRYKKAFAKNNINKFSQIIQRAFNLAERKLSIDGLTQLLGSAENFYVYSRIDGFRVGDENGDESIMSNSLGEFGNKNYLGPMAQALERTEMMEGEFYIYWLMTRLI